MSDKNEEMIRMIKMMQYSFDEASKHPDLGSRLKTCHDACIHAMNNVVNWGLYAKDPVGETLPKVYIQELKKAVENLRNVVQDAILHIERQNRQNRDPWPWLKNLWYTEKTKPK